VRTRVERILAIGLLAFLLGLALAAQFLQPSSDTVDGSAASAEPEGRRALLLLLRDLGIRAEAWSGSPGALPREGALLWLARSPLQRSEEPEPAEKKGNPADESREAKPARAPSPAALGLRSSAHYRRFVEEGGTLVLRQSDEARKFLVDEMGLSACADVHASRVAKAGLRHLGNSRGEVLDIEVREGGVLLAPDTGSTAYALWWGGTESAAGEDVLAMVVPEGSGQVVLLGDDAFLANGRIGERDHALFAVRLVEEFARSGRVLLDEYALGLWHPRTAMSLLASPSLFLASLHLPVLLLLFLWRSAWVREFPRDPPALEAVSPLVRARSLAALLSRAGRFDLLARPLREETLRRLERRSRTSAARVRAVPEATCRSTADLERLHESLRAVEREAG
jgi:hypothetical protein